MTFKAKLLVKPEKVYRSEDKAKEFTESDGYNLSLSAIERVEVPNWEGWGPDTATLHGYLVKSRKYFKKDNLYVPSEHTAIKIRFDPAADQHCPKGKNTRIRALRDGLNKEFEGFLFLDPEMEPIDLIPQTSSDSLRNDLEKFATQMYTLSLSGGYTYDRCMRAYQSRPWQKIEGWEEECCSLSHQGGRWIGDDIKTKKVERRVYNFVMGKLWKKERNR